MRDALSAERIAVSVWDLPVRLFHWSLLIAVATAAISGFLLPVTWLDLHLIAGSIIVALLLFRLIWGFTGSTYSRFSSFMFSPATTLAHLRAVLRGTSPHFPGHNPVGAAMILALLLTLVALTLTGTIVLGGAEKQGPLKAFVSYATGSFTREVHQIAAFALLFLVACHVGGVVLESWRSAENLPLSMVTGEKRSSLATPIAPPLGWATLGGAVVAIVLIGGPVYAMWRMPAAGIPHEVLDADYVKACGDCHIPFHPSLRGTAAWAAIMATLDDHFGEDASLGSAETARLAAYLEHNAAERWDTRAANVFRDSSPLRITETRFWQRRHAGLDAAVFTTKRVGAKSNCEACHGDARLGLFMPQSINIPKE